jgi:hypothetical protein
MHETMTGVTNSQSRSPTIVLLDPDIIIPSQIVKVVAVSLRRQLKHPMDYTPHAARRMRCKHRS